MPSIYPHGRRPADATLAQYGCLFLVIRFMRSSAWVVLAFLLVMIVKTGSGWATTFDGLVLVFTALIGLGMRLERRILLGETESQASNRGGSSRALAMLVAVVLALWIIANVLGNHIIHHVSGES